jgi:UDP-glucose 4-epimerase
MSDIVLVTGGAGFVGSHLVDGLLARGLEVRIIDNLSSGNREWIPRDQGLEFIRGDINDRDLVAEALDGCDHVYHMAADPVIRGGFADSGTRESQVGNNFSGTWSLLEAMVEQGTGTISFASSSVVYGDAVVIPTPEDYGPMRPVSIYGATKLASEGLITAYSHGFDLSYWIFRFANVVGPRSSLGVVHDFVSKLKRDPTNLEILGDGKQSKCYLHVLDCVDAMLYVEEGSHNEIFNLGTPTPISVDRVAELVIEEMGLEGVKLYYTGGTRGWKGDLPKTFLDTSRIRSLGWSPGRDSEEAVREMARACM